MRHPSGVIRELAQRESSGVQFTLLWRTGTQQLWVQIAESDPDVTLAVSVPADRALDAFYHPYAYLAARSDDAMKLLAA